MLPSPGTRRWKRGSRHFNIKGTPSINSSSTRSLVEKSSPWWWSTWMTSLGCTGRTTQLMSFTRVSSGVLCQKWKWEHQQCSKARSCTFFKIPMEYTMKITMTKFIQTLDSGQIPRGRLQQPPGLSPAEQRELRSVSGCLQWAATQARPEISPAVSLTPHGAEATIYDLKSLYSTIDFLKATSENGITIQDVPVGKDSLLVGYSDASWANAKKSGSQIGVVIGLTSKEALTAPSKFAVLDWKSSRSPRVCRSTLAAEASAGDEAADRSSFANLFLSELIYLEPAHKVGNRLAWVQATDASHSMMQCWARIPTWVTRGLWCQSGRSRRWLLRIRCDGFQRDSNLQMASQRLTISWWWHLQVDAESHVCLDRPPGKRRFRDGILRQDFWKSERKRYLETVNKESTSEKVMQPIAFPCWPLTVWGKVFQLTTRLE